MEAIAKIAIGFLMGLCQMSTSEKGTMETFDQKVAIFPDGSAKFESTLTFRAEAAAKMDEKIRKEGGAEEVAKHRLLVLNKRQQERGMFFSTFKVDKKGDHHVITAVAYTPDMRNIHDPDFSIPCRANKQADGAMTVEIGSETSDEECRDLLERMRGAEKGPTVTIVYTLPGEIVKVTGYESVVSFKGRELTVKATKEQLVKLLEEAVKTSSSPPLRVECKPMTPEIEKEYAKFKDELAAAEKGVRASPKE